MVVDEGSMSLEIFLVHPDTFRTMLASEFSNNKHMSGFNSSIIPKNKVSKEDSSPNLFAIQVAVILNSDYPAHATFPENTKLFFRKFSISPSSGRVWWRLIAQKMGDRISRTASKSERNRLSFEKVRAKFRLKFFFHSHGTLLCVWKSVHDSGIVCLKVVFEDLKYLVFWSKVMDLD